MINSTKSIRVTTNTIRFSGIFSSSLFSLLKNRTTKTGSKRFGEPR